MKAQQAPTGCPTLSARQASRPIPSHTALKTTKFRIGGTITAISAMASSVIAEFSGDENRLRRSHPIRPLVAIGAGSGGKTSLLRKAGLKSTELMTALPSPFDQRDALVEPVHEGGGDQADDQIDAHHD